MSSLSQQNPKIKTITKKKKKREKFEMSSCERLQSTCTFRTSKIISQSTVEEVNVKMKLKEFCYLNFCLFVKSY